MINRKWMTYLCLGIVSAVSLLGGPAYVVLTERFCLWHVLVTILYYFAAEDAFSGILAYDVALYGSIWNVELWGEHVLAYLDGYWNLLYGYAFHYFSDNRIFVLMAIKSGHSSFFQGLLRFFELHLQMAEKATSLLNFWSLMTPGSTLFDVFLQARENVEAIKQDVAGSGQWLNDPSRIYDFHVKCEQTVDLFWSLLDLIQTQLILAGYPMAEKEVICLVDGKIYTPGEEHHGTIVLPRV